MSGSQALHRTHLIGEPDLARNYSIRLRWMVLLSLLAFLPCSQVSVWLAVEQLDAVVDHQQAALHPDRLLRGHVDQLIGVPDLGLLVRTFAQESTFPGVALQQIYEMLRPKFLKRDLEEQVVGVVAGTIRAALYWPGSPYPPLASSSPGTQFIVILFKLTKKISYPVAGTAAHHYAIVTGVVEATVDKGSRTIRDLSRPDGYALLHHGVAHHGGLDGHGRGDPGLPVLHGWGESRGGRKAFLSSHQAWTPRGRSALWSPTWKLAMRKIQEQCLFTDCDY